MLTEPILISYRLRSLCDQGQLEAVRMPWYVQKSDRVLGPFEDSQLKAFAAAKRIGKETKISNFSGGPWVSASNVKELFPERVAAAPQVVEGPRPVYPPLPKVAAIYHPAESAIPQARLEHDEQKRPIGTAGQVFDLDARKVFSLYRLFWTRVLKSDFSVIGASDQEISELVNSTSPVNSSLAQNYASWRRSLLMISLLMLGVSMLFNAVDIFKVLASEQRPAIMKFQTSLLFFFQLGASLLCLMAARDWCDLKRSRSWARYAWLAQFLGPFLIFMIPLSIFVSDEIVLAWLGANVVLILIPKILGIFPGLIRCSLTMKTLLPESPVAGWLAIMIAPLFAIFLMVATTIALQINEKLLALGFFLIAVSMAVVVMQWEHLLQPAAQAQASKAVGRIKWLQRVFQVAGITCIGVFVLFNLEIQLTVINRLLLFIFSLAGNVTLLTVVMSDVLLAMIHKEHQRATDFAGTEMANSLAARLGDLSACGLTDFRAGEAEIVAGLRTHGGTLATGAAAKGNQFFRQVTQQPTSSSKASPPPPHAQNMASSPEMAKSDAGTL